MKKTLVVIVAVIVVILVAFVLFHSVGPTIQQAPSDSGTAAVANSRPTETLNVTLDANGQTVTVARGSSLRLALGDRKWNITLSNPSILGLQNASQSVGVQGTYLAQAVGTTELEARGEPVCGVGVMCAKNVIDFKISVVVR